MSTISYRRKRGIVSEIKLKNCPHCGRTDIPSFEGFAFCNDCGYDLPVDWWNKRANPWRKIESEDDLPPVAGKYLFTAQNGKGERKLFRIHTRNMHKYRKLLAWMPLPEPFQE
jgi:hypothetical protein